MTSIIISSLTKSNLHRVHAKISQNFPQTHHRDSKILKKIVAKIEASILYLLFNSA